jgi:hypothetical protein
MLRIAQYEYYKLQDQSLISHLSQFIKNTIGAYDKFFDICTSSRIFVSAEGKKKLKEEWPLVWEEFELSN